MTLLTLPERTLPWSPFGTIFNTDENITTAQMLERAGLSGWDVQVEDIPLPAGYETDKPLFMTTRATHTGRFVLSTVGKRYRELQNEELFSFGDALLDGGKWVGAGSFHNGRVVFGTLLLNNQPEVAGIKMQPFMVVSTSHDGTLAIQASNTMINPVCWNTLIAAIKGATQKFKIRHTSSLSGRLLEARTALGIANTYVDLWTEFMNPLADKAVTDSLFDEIVNREFNPGPEATPNATTRWENKYAELWDIWQGETVQGAGIKNTAFGLWNTLNESHGWGRGGRGDNAEENAAAARSGFNGPWNAENDRLLAIAASV